MKRLFIIATSLLMIGCAGAYKPANTKGTIGGYTEAKISEGKYRVTFQGQGEASPPEVYKFFLLRAAELTQHEGYSHFKVSDAHDDNLQRSAMHVHVSIPNYTGTITMLKASEKEAFDAAELIKSTARE